MSSIIKKKEKNIIKDKNSNENFLSNNKSSSYSDSSSIFDNINFSEIFNPNDKFRNIGEQTSYDLSSYNLGTFSSLSSICKNLNISYDKIFNKSIKFSNKLNLEKKIKIKENNENSNENIINTPNNKDNILTDSIIKILLSEENSIKPRKKMSQNTIKKLNSSGISLNQEELDELLKDYFPMEIDKK